MASSPFKSFFQGGFESSTHRRKDGRRLDVIAATAHDLYAESDYTLLQSIGIKTVRDALRWHLIEKTPLSYDWSSFLPMLRAARLAKTQVIWDLFHYGWPDDLDIWSPKFVDRYAAFAGATAKLIRDETSEIPLYVPINEISYTSWAGGEEGTFNPYGEGRGEELKIQLVRAAIAGIEAIWEVEPRARILHVDPAINVIPTKGNAASERYATRYNATQFEAWDMLSGRLNSALGGSPRYLDIIGINYYNNNQWTVAGRTVKYTNPRAQRFLDMICENYQRYERPILIAETGTEGKLRPEWFKYICGEVWEALAREVPVLGICLYPILNHPRWVDDRHCANGLIDYSRKTFVRSFETELLQEYYTQLSNWRNREALDV